MTTYALAETELFPGSIYFWDFVLLLPFPIHSLSIMVDFTAVYAVGFSVSLVYVSKLGYEAWGVWKQYGLVVLYFSCGIGHVKGSFII